MMRVFLLLCSFLLNCYAARTDVDGLQAMDEGLCRSFIACFDGDCDALDPYEALRSLLRKQTKRFFKDHSLALGLRRFDTVNIRLLEDPPNICGYPGVCVLEKKSDGSRVEIFLADRVPQDLSIMAFVDKNSRDHNSVFSKIFVLLFYNQHAEIIMRYYQPTIRLLGESKSSCRVKALQKVLRKKRHEA